MSELTKGLSLFSTTKNGVETSRLSIRKPAIILLLLLATNPVASQVTPNNKDTTFTFDYEVDPTGPIPSRYDFGLNYHGEMVPRDPATRRPASLPISYFDSAQTGLNTQLGSLQFQNWLQAAHDNRCGTLGESHDQKKARNTIFEYFAERPNTVIFMEGIVHGEESTWMKLHAANIQGSTYSSKNIIGIEDPLIIAVNNMMLYNSTKSEIQLGSLFDNSEFRREFLLRSKGTTLEPNVADIDKKYNQLDEKKSSKKLYRKYESLKTNYFNSLTGFLNAVKSNDILRRETNTLLTTLKEDWAKKANISNEDDIVFSKRDLYAAELIKMIVTEKHPSQIFVISGADHNLFGLIDC